MFCNESASPQGVIYRLKVFLKEKKENWYADEDKSIAKSFDQLLS